MSFVFSDHGLLVGNRTFSEHQIQVEPFPITNVNVKCILCDHTLDVRSIFSNSFAIL